jgi:hypothetical protein
MKKLFLLFVILASCTTDEGILITKYLKSRNELSQFKNNILVIPSFGCQGCVIKAIAYSNNYQIPVILIASTEKEYNIISNKNELKSSSKLGWINYSDAKNISLSTEFPSWITLDNARIRRIRKLTALDIDSGLDSLSLLLKIK